MTRQHLLPLMRLTPTALSAYKRLLRNASQDGSITTFLQQEREKVIALNPGYWTLLDNMACVEQQLLHQDFLSVAAMHHNLCVPNLRQPGSPSIYTTALTEYQATTHQERIERLPEYLRQVRRRNPLIASSGREVMELVFPQGTLLQAQKKAEISPPSPDARAFLADVCLAHIYLAQSYPQYE